MTLTEAEALRQDEAARTGAAVAELPERGLFAVAGPTRQKFLHNILSNEVAALAPGQGRRAALMDVKGHLVALLRVLAGPGEVVLELPGSRVDAVEALLVHYKVAAPVRFSRPPGTVLALVGPRGREVLVRSGLEVPEAMAAEDHVTRTLLGADVRVARAGDLPPAGFVLHVPPEATPAVRDALVSAGALPLSRSVLDALRVEHGRPWYGPDVTEENLLHETGLLGELHSPAKGCYVGQEVVARLEARGGNVNKMMRGLSLSAPAAAGAEIQSGGKAVGHVTTAAISPRLGPIALGYVHRSASAPGTAVTVSGAPATVVALPFPPSC